MVSDIGDEVLAESVEPALKASRAKKNELYSTFDNESARAGGIFTAKEVGDKFDRVIAKNGMKNTKGIESVKRDMKEAIDGDTSYTLKEIDDLISNVTDAMPDCLLKSKTAQQVSAELADSLDSVSYTHLRAHET